MTKDIDGTIKPIARGIRVVTYYVTVQYINHYNTGTPPEGQWVSYAVVMVILYSQHQKAKKNFLSWMKVCMDSPKGHMWLMGHVLNGINVSIWNSHLVNNYNI